MARTFGGVVALLAAASHVYALGSQCTAALGSGSAAAAAPFWMQNITRQGTSPFNSDPSTYKVYRDVTAYGAKGDGVTDDTLAINMAISDGNRCGDLTCQSSTLTPALVYFPSGTYLISSPILQYYYTSLVGDAKNKPTIVASSSFVGIALIDANPYTGGAIPAGGWNCPSADPQWYCSVNNFFRSVRNVVLDTRNIPATTAGTGIHWQVGQATSLIGIDFLLSTASGNLHQGLFIENGSGGFIADLTISGGAFGMWISNQQFTIHNVSIDGADVAIYQQWNWQFTWKDITITNARIGFNINTTGQNKTDQSTGSITVLDSSISASSAAVLTTNDQSSKLGGAVFLQNVNLGGAGGVVDGAGNTYVASGEVVNQFFLGNEFSGTSTSFTYNTKATPGPDLPSQLLDSTSSNNGVFFRTRPQYEAYAFTEFESAKSNGVKCDGTTDDTAALQSFIDNFWGCKILYLDAGVCKVSSTITIPTGSIVVGEFWTTILASGSAFNDATNPTPVLKIGNAGDEGGVEISDVVVTTVAGSAGAVAIEWNTNGDPGTSGAWDVHVRIGGAIGTDMQIAQCPTSSTSSDCIGGFLGLHILGGGYFENVWIWTADHDLDDLAQTQINVFNARGVFIDQATGPIWMVGTAAEHSAFYQYSIVDSGYVYMGMIQTETPYYQPSPAPPAPFTADSAWADPSWENSGSAWALTISNSSNVYVYGAGLYSFYQDYSEDCETTTVCQKSIAQVDAASSDVYIYGLSTIGATTMLTVGGTAVVASSDNVDGLQSTMSKWAFA
ncbi:Glycoside hydrolase family 55 protein [Mycena chlorophos]|uniref:Glycoside hydrolase family 55 protein n=1 Tax=Mycena chlorophos TaxID=658473 RepID=A0A8H6VUC1_MYCCL|nr:Glycoside hydrolase family 55 protein [Mycena chlorophos]